MGRGYSGSGMGQAIDLQSIGADIHIFGEIDSTSRRHFNPSIAFQGDELKIAIRSCNFVVEPFGRWYLRDGNAYSKTEVLYGDLDPDTFKVSDLKELKLSDDSPTRIKVAGLEDVRLFSRDDGMHAIGFASDRLTRSLHNRSASLAEYIISGSDLKYIRTLEKPNPEGVEKNWMPADVAAPLFDFTYSPDQVWRDGEVLGLPYHGDIHGGSQLLLQEDGTYLSIVHNKVANRRLGAYDRFVYYTYLARHNEHGFITKLSAPFRFGTPDNIEFASGMVEYKGDLLISFGIRDCKFGIARIKKSKLVEMLNNN